MPARLLLRRRSWRVRGLGEPRVVAVDGDDLRGMMHSCRGGGGGRRARRADGQTQSRLHAIDAGVAKASGRGASQHALAATASRARHRRERKDKGRRLKTIATMHNAPQRQIVGTP